MVMLVPGRPPAPLKRLVDVSDGYRVAVEALRLAADLGCSGDLYAALWDLVTREAEAAEKRLAEKRG